MTALPTKWSEFLLKQFETGMGYQTVSITLVDGRTFDDVVIIDSSIVGEVRGHNTVPFDPAEIVAIIVTHRKWKFN